MKFEQIRRNNYSELFALESKYNSFYDEEFQTNIVYSSAWTTKERFDAEANTGKKTTGFYIPGKNGIDSYCIYRYPKEMIEIIKLEGSDAGTYELVNYLETRAKDCARKKIIMKCDERRLDLHIRLSGFGFKATKVIKNFFDDSAAYLFEYEVE